MRGHIFSVQRDSCVDAFLEDRFWYGRDRDEACGVCQACGIAGRAEDGDFVIRRAESLHALICLLAIVERRCHAMEAQEGICYIFGLRPDASLDTVVGFDMAIDCGEG